MRVITYLVTTLIVAVIVFILGAVLSGGFLTREVTAPWALVSVIAGLIGSLPIFGTEHDHG